MKKRMKRGSMTIEAALLMPLLLLVVTITLYLFFYVHNKVWLTAAAYEAALDGSMETARPEGKSRDKALKKGKELGNTGFYESKNLKLQVSEGKKVQVTYDLDMFSIYGGFNSHLQVKGSVKVIKPVTWIRKVKGLSEVSNKLKGKKMKSEYKRDINGNYLVLYENEEPDTSSYQMRMLVGNSIPSILKCRVQGVDGQFMVCYDITSKQSLISLYEEKKMGYEDLQMILGGFVQVMEDMSEYLLNPCRLVLKPEYMYVDVEKRQIYFCYLPGYDEDVRQKFQELTEYILPILDHEDSKAVMLGYGIYRRALEDSFHLEYIKKELYQDREEIEKTVGSSILQESGTMTEKRCNSDGSEKIDLFENYGESKEEKPQEEHLEELLWEEELSEKKKKDVGGTSKGFLIWCVAAGFFALVVVAAETLGYLPRVSMQVILGVAAGIMVIGMLCTWGVSVIKNKNCIRHEKKGHLEIQNKRENKKVSEDLGKDKVNFKDSIERNTTSMQNTAEVLHQKEKISISQKNCGETVVLSANIVTGPATLVSREPGELATIYLQNELTVIGKMENAADAVIELPTVSRIHAKIRKREGEYYLTDLNSRNGTSVNGKILKGDEEYCLQDQDQIDFAQARYVFLK